jgi:hypothetical protein
MELLEHLGLQLREQTGELGDASHKLIGLLESSIQAHALQSERK